MKIYIIKGTRKRFEASSPKEAGKQAAQYFQIKKKIVKHLCVKDIETKKEYHYDVRKSKTGMFKIMKGGANGANEECNVCANVNINENGACKVGFFYDAKEEFDHLDPFPNMKRGERLQDLINQYKTINLNELKTKLTKPTDLSDKRYITGQYYLNTAKIIGVEYYNKFMCTIKTLRKMTSPVIPQVPLIAPAAQTKNSLTYTNVDQVQANLQSIINASEFELVEPKPEFIKNNTYIKQNFIICTYWWGNNIFNRNYEQPCPPDQKEFNLKKINSKTKKFNEMIQDWKEQCQAMGCYCIAHEYKEFTVSKGYQAAINAKPLFIKKVLEFCKKSINKIKDFQGVVYIDGDMTVNSYPYIFEMENVDYMARGWNMDPRSSSKYLSEICFDPWIFETSGGIMYFGNTSGGHHILNEWIRANSRPVHQGKADDRIISLIFNYLGMFLSYNVIQLPIEYLWLTDIYGNVKDKSAKRYLEIAYNNTPITLIKKQKLKLVLSDIEWNKNFIEDTVAHFGAAPGFVKSKDYSPIVFEHPACLTSEEAAKDQGAADDRSTIMYQQIVEDRIECNIYIEQMFYEFIYFDNENAAHTYNNYLKYMSKNSIPNFNQGEYDYKPSCIIRVPYDKQYGKFNQNVNAKLEGQNQRISGLTSFLTINNSSGYTIKLLNAKTIIDILILLVAGNDVIYNADNENSFEEEELIRLKTEMEIYEGCEFAASITNDTPTGTKMYNFKPIFITNKPMFFSHKSKILRHLLLMSTDMNSFNDIFNSSFIFLQRIRCKFLEP